MTTEHPWPRADRPFSNSDMGETWMAHWCRTCVHDTAYKEFPERGCPIILDLLLHIPNDHIRRVPTNASRYVGVEGVICTKYLHNAAAGDGQGT